MATSGGTLLKTDRRRADALHAEVLDQLLMTQEESMLKSSVRTGAEAVAGMKALLDKVVLE